MGVPCTHDSLSTKFASKMGLYKFTLSTCDLKDYTFPPLDKVFRARLVDMREKKTNKKNKTKTLR